MPDPIPNDEQFNIVIEENKNKLQQIVDLLSQHPAKAFFSFTIKNLQQLIQNPFDLPTVLDTLCFIPQKTSIGIERRFPFRDIIGVALVSDTDFYSLKFREKYNELIKEDISLDFKLAMSNVICRWAQDVKEWADKCLKETPTDAENVSKSFEDFLTKEKGWGGIARLLVLGRTGPYNNPNDELDKYSSVPEEINFARRLWLERREKGQRNGPFLQAFVESIPMKTR